MGKVKLTRTLHQPAKDIWSHIKDFKNIQKILPAISHADLASQHDCGMGAERICYMKGAGFALHERVIDWKEGESYTIEIYKTSMPMMESSITTVGVKPLTATSSEVFFEANYKVKYGWFGKMMDAVMMNFMMRFMISGLFGALANEVEKAKLLLPEASTGVLDA